MSWYLRNFLQQSVWLNLETRLLPFLSVRHPGQVFLLVPCLLAWPLPKSALPGRRVDLHGADGHVPGQVLQAGDWEGPDHPWGHPGKDRRLGGGHTGSSNRLSCQLTPFQQCSSSYVHRSLKLWSICTATCRSSIEVMTARLGVVTGPCCWLLTNFSCLSHHRRETIQRADQHSGSGEDVRLRHQRLPRGLGG